MNTPDYQLLVIILSIYSLFMTVMVHKSLNGWKKALKICETYGSILDISVNLNKRLRSELDTLKLKNKKKRNKKAKTPIKR